MGLRDMGASAMDWGRGTYATGRGKVLNNFKNSFLSTTESRAARGIVRDLGSRVGLMGKYGSVSGKMVGFADSKIGRYGAVGMLGAVSATQLTKSWDSARNGHYGSAVLRGAVGASAAYGAIGYSRFSMALGNHLAMAASSKQAMGAFAKVAGRFM